MNRMKAFLALLLATCACTLGLAREPAAAIRFTDVTAAAGLQFRHVSGGSGRYYFIEQWGSGAAFLDYDGDGWQDIFLAQGGALPGFTAKPPAGNRLFRNTGGTKFVDVTAAAGLESRRYTLGVATADYDNDGDPDLFITAVQGNVLYRNDRGRFTDVTTTAGLAGKPLSTSAAFLDYDADGRLDLFVARYQDYAVETDQGCEVPDYGMGPPGAKPRKTFCGPSVDGVASHLYRNEGGGRFRDVTAASGVGAAKGRGLGVAAADYNDDGRLDIFVASDQMPNLLFAGLGGGRFDERALAAGVAMGTEGRAYAGMGVDAADYDNDGRIDLVITNYENEPTSLYRNRGGLAFDDESRRSGLSPWVWGFMKWGTRLLDFNGDGLKDLFVANGHIYDDPGLAPSQGAQLPGAKRKGHAQESQVLAQGPRGTFTDASSGAGPFFRQRRVSRGAAFGDFDNDGDWDALVTSIDAPPSLLRNDAPAGRWARLTLEGHGCNRDGIGARVRVTSGDLTQTQVVHSGTSYLSDHDHRPLFALPGRGTAEAEIRWPCGAIQKVSLAEGRTTAIKEVSCKVRE